MVTVSAPTHLARSIAGAFFINEDALRRIEAYAAAIYSSETTTRYSLVLKDGSEYSVDAIDRIQELPLHDKLRRETFKIKTRLKSDVWESFEIYFTYGSPSHARVIVFSNSDIRSKFDHLVGDVSAQKIWYSSPHDIYHNVVSAPFFFIVVGFWLFLKIEMKPDWLPFVFGVFAAFTTTYIVQVSAKLLFDPHVVYFGEEAARQDRKRSARRWVFGTFGTGIALALVAAALRFVVPSA